MVKQLMSLQQQQQQQFNVIVISRPHRSYSGLLLYTHRSLVDRSVGHVHEPCENDWTDRDAVWGLTRVDQINHVLDEG